jgi:predicted XRE-type DNA-binding protein
VKSPFDKPETLEVYFRKNTELDPDHSGCWRWRGPPVKGRRYRKKDGVLRALYRIVFEHFKGPIPDRYDVHHSCENPHCVNPTHLEALTRGEHMKMHIMKAHLNGRIGKGEKNSNAVLTNEAVREIFNLVKKGVLQREIGGIYGVTQPSISNLLHNRAWPHNYAEVFQGAPPKDYRFRSGFARRRAS